MQESYEKGVAIRSASSFASGAARLLAKRKQRYRWAGYRASKNCNQDADAVDLAEGNMTEGASASRRSVLRSHRPQTRLEASSEAVFMLITINPWAPPLIAAA